MHGIRCVLLIHTVCHCPLAQTYAHIHYPLNDPIGPIWSRSHATQEDGMEETCKSVDAVKKALGVSAIPGLDIQKQILSLTEQIKFVQSD